MDCKVYLDIRFSCGKMKVKRRDNGGTTFSFYLDMEDSDNE